MKTFDDVFKETLTPLCKHQQNGERDLTESSPVDSFRRTRYILPAAAACHVHLSGLSWAKHGTTPAQVLQRH